MRNITETDQWQLTGYFKWVPKRPDTKQTCRHCKGSGYNSFTDEKCFECSGNGFYYTHNTTEPEPKMDKGLIEHMRQAFKDYNDAINS